MSKTNLKSLERRANRLGVNVGRSNASWRGENEDGTISRWYVNANGYTTPCATLEGVSRVLDRMEGREA
ncbi:hypothetical protein [Methylobacterium radiotolerans]|uniref:hypothetical protein n=1 Tax=Methylobacterium radiotolerans TaxID=31998 RepID=UPI001F45F9B0|nr:hypothetical protein [Methylobacterium radiotolerans]UIY45819.1 hypothetical protein LZ599_32450 [Methylobacterium radiotolerans]